MTGAAGSAEWDAWQQQRPTTLGPGKKGGKGKAPSTAPPTAPPIATPASWQGGAAAAAATIGKVLGHSNTSTTATYAHLLETPVH